MLLADRVGPVGPNDEAVEVADNQKRRVFEGQRVLLKLSESGIEVLTLTLVLPPKMAALPDIGQPSPPVLFVAPRSKQ